MILEDTAAVKRSKKTGSMMLEMLALVCAHPAERSIGVSVTYSHRHYPGDEDARFLERAEKVLGSVELTK